ncbi:hypothetical protein LINPERHAP1_LOCUS10243, partial [Linum perenne]
FFFLCSRFSELCVVGFHAGSSVGLVADQARLVDLIANEYITFPILLYDKNFSEMEHGACYVLFGDSEDPLIYHEKDLDLGILCTAIEELHVRQKQNSDDSNSCLECLKGTWSKQSDTLKEPHAASYLQNLLLHFPGCVSADVCGSRLFFSDSNHHRIIISDENGQILDCVSMQFIALIFVFLVPCEIVRCYCNKGFLILCLPLSRVSDVCMCFEFIFWVYDLSVWTYRQMLKFGIRFRVLSL